MTSLWPNQSSASLISARGCESRTRINKFFQIYSLTDRANLSQAVQLRATDSATDAESQCVRPASVCARYSGQSEQHKTSVHPHGL